MQDLETDGPYHNVAGVGNAGAGKWRTYATGI